jgi:hypothetical protein
MSLSAGAPWSIQGRRAVYGPERPGDTRSGVGERLRPGRLHLIVGPVILRHESGPGINHDGTRLQIHRLGQTYEQPAVGADKRALPQ